jgi:hypothetical protein
MILFSPTRRLLLLLFAFLFREGVHAVNGGRSMVEATNGWRSIEVISEGESAPGSSWRMPGNFDGVGAFLTDEGNTIRVQVNHELDDDAATISEINLSKRKVKQAIIDTFKNNGSSLDFVESSRRAFDQWTRNDGDEWSTGSNFCRFCSSQSYEPNTFGTNRGFVDQLYITGEECSNGRLFALKSDSRELYQLSGVTGSWDGTTGHGGMTFDSFENAALIDTGDTQHIALLLSADGGSHTLKLFVGKKGVDADGNSSGSFLARNGLLYGEWYYLGNVRSTGTNEWMGGFVTNPDNAIKMDKFEDIDTNPNKPRQVVLAESTSGVYVIDFNLKIVSDGFEKATSNFSMKMISNSEVVSWYNPDNVDWTENNLIFVNRDTGEGGIFYMKPDGDGKTAIGRTNVDGESTGILDLSNLLNYPPASVMITTNQGRPSSMTLLLNPDLEDMVISGGEDNEENSSFGSSVVICPKTTSAENLVVQAEDAELHFASASTREEDYCGDGYVDFDDSSSTAGIMFTVDIASRGTYTTKIRYANGSPNPRPGLFFVDTVYMEENYDFRSTGDWSSWNVESKIVTLDEGRHELEIWWEDGKRPNIDLLSVDRMEIYRPRNI